MITSTMQVKLEESLNSQTLEKGTLYVITPSDCRGSDLDLTVKSRVNESGDYVVNGRLCRVKISLMIGDTWKTLIPMAYNLILL